MSNESKVKTETKRIINPSFLVYSLELVEAIKQGWDIDPNDLPSQAFQCEVGLIREYDEENPPKLTRAEILEKARAVKKAKEETAK